MTLEEVVERGVEQSATLRFERREVEILGMRHLLERRNYLPTLSLSFAADTAVTPDYPDSRSRRLSAGVRQMVYDGGRLSRARGVQEAEISLRRLDVQKLTRQIRREAWNTAVRYQVNLDRVEVLETASGVVRQHTRIAGRRFERGEITETEYVESMLEAAELEDELRAARLETEQARLQLNRLLEYPAETRVEIIDGFSAEQLPEPVTLNERQLLRLALQQNTELRRQELRVFSARQEAKNAARWFIPQVSLRIDGSLAAETLPLREPEVRFGIEVSWQGHSPVSGSVTAGAGSDDEVRRGSEMTVEPFQSVTGSMEEATLHLEADRAGYERRRLEQELQFTVSQSLSLLELSHERWESNLERRDLLRRRLAIVEAQEDIGRALEVDVLTAVRELLAAELALLEAGHTVIEHWRDVDELTGGHTGDL